MNAPCISREIAARFIDQEYMCPQSNKVLHTHPSPMMWRSYDGSAMDRWKKRSLVAMEKQLHDNLYLGIPFCIPTEPKRCGFCLFPTTDFRGKDQLRTYLGYLEREAELLGDVLKNDSLTSIYVGGGTPNLMRDEDYHLVMSIARTLYGSVPDHIEKTIEGIPQLFTRDKVDAIKKAGFNRVSMGVQQMSDRLIRYSGRRQTHQHVVDALGFFNDARLACNVDLIYGWPEQAIDDMLHDLGELVDFGVPHITHYQLNIAGLSSFSKAHRDVLPPIEEMIEMYRESVRYLSAHGYRQATVYDWERIGVCDDRFAFAGAEEYRYESHLRNFVQIAGDQVVASHNMIGVGFAAISYFPYTWPEIGGPNWCHMNLRSLDGYYSSLDKGLLPVEKQFHYQPIDIKLSWLFQSMQEMKIDCRSYEVSFGSDVVSDFRPIWDELESRGWIRVSDQVIQFIDLGRFHIPMLQALLSEARLEEIRCQGAGEIRD
ncbi:MAG TPA: coproporphyrinogen-III oxidase family protein [Syntrophales bacterium]|nr:coproporphyrinogen-III oxidase family protein [Syntrophales bacterium]